MAAKEAEILGKYLPENSISYCIELWKSHSIQLKITKPRKSIYGNYFFRNGAHHITVNGNLSKEAFLVTFLHEVGHLLVRKNQRRRVKPHGSEWQAAFREVMQPVLHSAVFPEHILTALFRHMNSPAASSCSDPVLHLLLSGEEPSEGKIQLSHLPEGQAFRFQERFFVRLKSLRSRCECRCIQSGRLYRISSSVLVEKSEQQADFPKINSGVLLKKLPAGKVFKLDNRTFRVREMKISRMLCEETSSGRLFLIPGDREIAEEDL
jgi:hypothetical protein